MAAPRVGLRDITQARRSLRLRLLAPLRYLSIANTEKRKYDLTVPAICTVLLLVAYHLVTPSIIIFGESGLLKLGRDVLIMAVPFMVGALAAVSMGAPGPYLDRRFAGVELVLDGRVLTARQFVCYLLGYLCFLGLVTLGLSIVAQVGREAVLAWTSDYPILRAIVRDAGLTILFALISSLAVTTFWSLYFLTDVVNRPVHQQEPPVISREDVDPPEDSVAR